MIKHSRMACAIVLSALLFSTLHIAAPVLAADSPIRIEADHMSSLEKDSSVVFTGNVDARQEDVRIRSDRMTVYYTQKAKDPGAEQLGQKMEKMVCDGNVEITRGQWLGTSKEMIYLSRQRQFHLIGDARAWQGQNMVSGDKIIYYLDEGRSEVVADRTSATIGESTDTKKKKPGRVNMTILQQ